MTEMCAKKMGSGFGKKKRKSKKREENYVPYSSKQNFFP